MPISRLPVLALCLFLGCSSELDFGYARDGELRMNHLQAVGSHNSYHRRDNTDIVEWDYEHLPLGEQLETQGVRQVELDIHWVPAEKRFVVYHLTGIDEKSTCEYLSDCIGELRAWSEKNRGHHPIGIFIEAKDGYDAAAYAISPHVDIIDEEIRRAWPDRRIEPDDIRGTHPTLREAVTTKGWPTLGETRGHAFFVLLNRVREPGGALYEYTRGMKSLEGRAMFVTCDESDPFAGVLAIDDPKEKERIEAAARANFIVRTYPSDRRSDRSFGTEDRDAALSGYAHYISTDYPAPGIVEGYDVAMPGGTPSRCHPLAPAGCTSQDIEDPEKLQPR